MAITRNRPSRCIHSSTPSVGSRRWLYRLKLHLICRIQLVELAVQQIDKKSNQWSLSHTVRVMHVCRRPSPPGAVNTRPPAVAVYIALADGRCAAWRHFLNAEWDKVPQGSTFIFGDTLISLKTQRSVVRGKPVCEKMSLIRAAVSIQL